MNHSGFLVGRIQLWWSRITPTKNIHFHGTDSYGMEMYSTPPFILLRRSSLCVHCGWAAQDFKRTVGEIDTLFIAQGMFKINCNTKTGPLNSQIRHLVFIDEQNEENRTIALICLLPRRKFADRDGMNSWKLRSQAYLYRFSKDLHLVWWYCLQNCPFSAELSWPRFFHWLLQCPHNMAAGFAWSKWPKTTRLIKDDSVVYVIIRFSIYLLLSLT